MTPKQLHISLSQVKPTRNMVIYKAPDDKETIVPIYLSQEKLLAAFGRIPLSIRITVEDIS